MLIGAMLGLGVLVAGLQQAVGTAFKDRKREPEDFES